MKKALKNKKLYIIGAILAVVGIALPFGIYGITMIPSLNATPFPYMYLLFVFAFLYLFIGYVVSDLQITRWRRANHVFDGKPSDEIIDKAWETRLPFYLAFIVIFVVCLFFEIWYLIAGGYPLPY